MAWTFRARALGRPAGLGLAGAFLLTLGLPAATQSQEADPDLSGFEDQDSPFGQDEDILGGAGDEAFGLFEEESRASFAAFDAAVQEAFAEVERAVATVWGEQLKLPERKTWVGYSENLETRIIVDYEKGEVVVESVDENVSEEDIKKLLADTLEADSANLDAQDVLAAKIRERTAETEVEMAPPAPKPAPEVAELGKLVDQAVAPVAETRTAVDASGKTKTVKRLSIPFVPSHERLSVEKVAAAVKAYAKRYDVPRALILAIVKNESSFNPRAQSPVPAFGLMQLVPSSGGYDALRMVSGRDLAPSPDLLFQVNGNIELGAAYLHILLKRYLKSITNEQSRIYCAIAAYNTGAGNVARAFTGRTSVRKAAKIINAMTPEEVYEHLVKNLPYQETRKYLPKVNKDYTAYRQKGWPV